MKKLCLAFLLLLVLPALAQVAPRKVPIPNPDAFVEPDSISIGVVIARPEDAGFKSLFRTCWNGLKERTAAGGGSPVLGTIMSFLGGKSEDVLLSFLPMQMLRVDRLDKDGQPVPTYGVTVTGWPGIQSLVYENLIKGDNGDTLPSKRVGGATVYYRGKPEENGRALTRYNGTAASFPNLGVAERVIPRVYGGANVTMPEGPLRDVLDTVDRSKDTYGVVLNKNGSMMKILIWLNARDTNRVIQEVGQERFANLMPHVLYLTWQGDLVSDDEMDLSVHFQADSDQAAEELADVLKAARGVLNKFGRAGELQMTTVGKQVLLDIAMVGYRQLLYDYLDSIAGKPPTTGNNPGPGPTPTPAKQ